MDVVVQTRITSTFAGIRSNWYPGPMSKPTLVLVSAWAVGAVLFAVGLTFTLTNRSPNTHSRSSQKVGSSVSR